MALQGLARQIRARRFDCGSLRIDGVKVSFGLDANGVPNDCSSFERKEANELIEEVSTVQLLAVLRADSASVHAHGQHRRRWQNRSRPARPGAAPSPRAPGREANRA